MFGRVKNFFTSPLKNAGNSAVYSASTQDVSIGETVEKLQDPQEVPMTDSILKVGSSQSYDEDDIELQIKPTLVKKSFKLVARDGKVETEVPRDHNQNHHPLVPDDELEDFRHDPIGRPDEPEEMQVEAAPRNIVLVHDVHVETFVELPPVVEDFAGSDVILINDDTSEAPMEDPLAIDELPNTSIEAAEEANPLSSSLSTNEEDVSVGEEILWKSVEEDELPANKPTSTPNARKTAEVHKTKALQKPLNDKSTEELRGENSDSGLGLETSALQSTLTSVTDSNASTPAQTPTRAQSSGKLKASGVTETAAASTDCKTRATLTNGNTLRSSLKRRLEPSAATEVAAKRPKRSVNFDNVKVYYFPRIQGFGCVPSTGGCTLGMTATHTSFRTMTLAEHASEIRRAHRMQCQVVQPRGSSSDDSDESEEDFVTEGEGSDADAETSGFLQPVLPRQRRALLKAAGIRKIDANEKVECRNIRNSREVCGCKCRDFCDPETCSCSLAGIKCQVDRAAFPCSCTRDSCGNGIGRIEFNPARVRTHFIHTIMRMDMENRQQHPLVYSMANCPADVSAVVPPTGAPVFYGMQSNYSSGYASPVYNCDQTANFYQQQNAHYGNVANGASPAQYQLDSLDNGLFAGGTTATPSYGELMPVYDGVNNSNSTTSNPTYHHGINYPTANAAMPTQMPPYGPYHHQVSSSYVPPTHTATLPPPVTYSTCAVPTALPYGTAATTAVSAAYSPRNMQPLAATAPSCPPVSNAAGSPFLDMNAPIASSSRVTQMNHMIQHNRNTTSALVAVAQSPSGRHALAIAATTAGTASIDTPPIDEARKNCLAAFEELAPPLHPTPIVAVVDGGSPVKPPQMKPPPPVTRSKLGIVANDQHESDECIVVEDEDLNKGTDDVTVVEDDDELIKGTDDAEDDEQLDGSGDVTVVEDNNQLDGSYDVTVVDDDDQFEGFKDVTAVEDMEKLDASGDVIAVEDDQPEGCKDEIDGSGDVSVVEDDEPQVSKDQLDGSGDVTVIEDDDQPQGTKDQLVGSSYVIAVEDDQPQGCKDEIDGSGDVSVVEDDQPQVSKDQLVGSGDVTIIEDDDQLNGSGVNTVLKDNSVATSQKTTVATTESEATVVINID